MLKTEHWDLVEYEVQKPDLTVDKNMNVVAAPNINGVEDGSDGTDGGM